MGVTLQGLEGDLLLKTMLTLLDQDIPSLPMHDAVYVQQQFKTQAKKAIEDAWMSRLNVKFKPLVKIDEQERVLSNNLKMGALCYDKLFKI